MRKEKINMESLWAKSFAETIEIIDKEYSNIFLANKTDLFIKIYHFSFSI